MQLLAALPYLIGAGAIAAGLWSWRSTGRSFDRAMQQIEDNEALRGRWIGAERSARHRLGALALSVLGGAGGGVVAWAALALLLWALGWGKS